MPGMKRDLWALAAVLSVVVLGSLAATGGYAWYLHSDLYRRRCSRALTEALGLPAEIGRVVPHTFAVTEFRDVRVWLPDHRDRVLICRSAVVRPLQAPPGGWGIEAFGGACEISTRTWLSEDYRGMLESGLRPGLRPGGPRQIRFEDFQISFQRPPVVLRFGSAAGTIHFEGAESGTANVIVRRLNDTPLSEPIALSARFSPRPAGVRLERVELRVPSLELRALGNLPGRPLQRGRFEGRLEYREQAGGILLTLRGTAEALDLAELTDGWLDPPATGRCPRIELRELRWRDGQLAALNFSGMLADVALAPLLASLGVPAGGGVLTLDVGQAQIGPEGIRRLSASGVCRDLDLAPITAAVGQGVLSGHAVVELSDLQIRDNHLVGLEAVVRVPPDAPDKWLERRLLTGVLQRALGLRLPDILPGRIAYTRLGLTLHVQEEKLWIGGLEEHARQTILTIRLGDAELPLIRPPDGPIDLTPLLDRIRARLHIPPSPAATRPTAGGG